MVKLFFDVYRLICTELLVRNNYTLSLFTKVKSHGFTLIELVVVIGILGVLAAVLITTIDPLDKINAANDSGAISAVTQLGKGNDSFAAQNSNGYSSGMGTSTATCTGGGATASTNTNNFAGYVYDLCAAGESKRATVTAPSAAYTLYYFASAAANGAWASCSNSGTKCLGAVVAVGPLQSRKYASTRYFIYANGKSCFANAAPTNANIGALCP